MSRQYTIVEKLSSVIYKLRAEGKTYRQIGEALGLTKEQIREFFHRQARKERRIAAGYQPLPKGRPRKSQLTDEQKKDNEIVLLKMKVELLENFLLEAGRR